MCWKVHTLLLAAVLVTPFLAASTPYRERVVSRVSPATSTVSVDGLLDEPAWDDAVSRELRFEVQPGENIVPPVRTEVLVTYDADRLLVAIRAHDPRPHEIRARFADRDDLWNDDWVGIALDTFNDERRAFEFVVNPLGVQLDAINDDVGGSYDTSWDAIWFSAGRITQSGFQVEMAIPFSQLRFPAVAGPQTWGWDVFRSYPREDRHHIGMWPRQRGSNTYLGQADKLVGFDGVRSGRQVEVAPTLTSVWAQQRPGGDLAAPLEGGSADLDLGVDVSWGISPDLTLSAAVNPDFSQVEADAVQVDINTLFSLYFAEKRPFFLEGVDTFDTPLNLLYTRTIADPELALKLTGKRGRHTFGLFSATDEVTTLIAPGAEGSSSAGFDLTTTATVGRYRYDLGRGSTVGAMVTDRRGSGYENTVASVDARLLLSPADTVTIHGATSTTAYSPRMQSALDQPGGEMEGGALVARYNHQTRSWRLHTAYSELDEQFRADLGFITQVGTRHGAARLVRFWWDDGGGWYNSFRVGAEVERTELQSGALLEREVEGWLRWEGARESSAVIGAGSRERVFAGVPFDQTFTELKVASKPFGNLQVDLEVDHGDWIDFEHVRPATRLEVAPTVSFTTGRHLSVQLRYLYSKLSVEGGRLFAAEVPELRMAWQHDLRTLVRLIVQSTTLRRDPELYDRQVDRRSRDLFGQLLFSYKLNPQSVLYLGYSDAFQSPAADPLTRSARAVFLKIGYAWLL